MKLRILALPVMLLMLVYSCNAQTSHSAILTWGASTTTGAVYNVMRSTSLTGPQTKIATGVTGLTFSDNSLPANSQFCYAVIATDPTGKLADADPTSTVCGSTSKDKAVSAGTLGVVFN